MVNKTTQEILGHAIIDYIRDCLLGVTFHTTKPIQPSALSQLRTEVNFFLYSA